MKCIIRNLFVINLFLCLLFLPSCAKDEVDTMGNIHGIVSDELGTPIQAASITLTPSGKTTTTGNDGRYEFNDLEPQQYTVSVTKADYSSNSKSVTIRAGETSKGDFVLKKGQAELKVNVTELIFGDADNLLSFEITNNGSGILEWQIKEDADWISVDPVHGTTSKEISTVSVSINRAGLSPNVENSYTLNVTSTNGGTKEVKIKLLAQTLLSANPTELNFGSAHNELAFALSNKVGTEAIAYTIVTSDPWIKVNPTMGEVTNKSTSIRVTIDRSNLAPGKRSGKIEIKSAQTGDMIIPITMEVLGGKIGVDPTQLNFSTNKTEDYLIVKKINGEGAIPYMLSVDQTWVSLAKTSGTAGSDGESVKITVNRAGLSPGSHTANVTVRGTGTNNVVVPVTVDVEDVTLTVSPTQLNFSTNKTEEYFTFRKTSGEGFIPYTLSVDQTWLSLSKTSGAVGTNNESIKVSANRNGLSTGVHTANITIIYASKTITIPVSITIKPEESYASATIISCDSRIQFKIVSCKRSGTSVIFKYTIENTDMGKDISDFRIKPPTTTSYSKIYDDQGNEYRYPLMTLGSDSSSEQNVTGALLQGMKVNASITIRNFSVVATKVAQIKIECLAYPNSTYELADKFFTFKNVPIY